MLRRACALALALFIGPVAAVAQDAPTETVLPPIQPIAPASSYTPPAPPPGHLSDRIVSYTIRAELDPSEGAKSVTGTETVTWRNPADVPVGELQFHLYLNAFRDERTTFMRESGGQLRGDIIPEKGFGSIEITSMTLADGTDLAPALEFIQPDDGNVDDRTVARVPLPSPIAPGATVTLEIGFVSKLPRVFARTGYKDNFFFVAQWYPKLGVFEPRGLRGRAEPGWNCHQFHANSEFYADFGTFDVEITTPEGFVVGATGALVSEQQADGKHTRRYAQADVHDFAWTADDNYVVATRQYAEPGFPEVAVTALVQKEHAALVDRHLDACMRSLSWFNENVGVYPYGTLTVVDPEEGAGGAGGMEYPTLITAGFLEMSDGTMPAEDEPSLELVIFHEFGHQYWYGMVASNEFEEPWLDEGINSYTEMLGLEEIWPEKRWMYLQYGGVNLTRLPIEFPSAGRTLRFAATPQFVGRGPLINNAWAFKGAYNYGINSYMRPSITLRTLEGILGRETMGRILKTYFERWRFRHPTSQDFFDVAEEVAGQDLTPYFTQFFRESRVLDYAVQRVEPIDETDPPADGRTGPVRVILERRGEAILPVQALVTREDGTTETLEWDGVARWRDYTLEPGSAIRSVVIDPERRLWLEANVTNNSWRAEPSLAGPLRLASQWALALQHALVLVSGAV